MKISVHNPRICEKRAITHFYSLPTTEPRPVEDHTVPKPDHGFRRSGVRRNRCQVGGYHGAVIPKDHNSRPPDIQSTANAEAAANCDSFPQEHKLQPIVLSSCQ